MILLLPVTYVITATIMPSVPELENQSEDYKDDFHLRRKISFFKVTVGWRELTKLGIE